MKNQSSSKASSHWQWVERELRFGAIHLRVLAVQNFESLTNRFLSELTDLQDERLFPYFAVVWPSALGLCHYIATNFRSVDSLRVLEVGCGLGLPTLLFSRLGAKVVALDCNPEIGAWINRHSNLNGLPPVPFVAEDFMAPRRNHGLFDVIIASDVIYEPHAVPALLDFVKDHLKPRGQFIYADPGRFMFDQLIEGCGFNRYYLEGASLKIDGTLIEIVVGSKAS